MSHREMKHCAHEHRSNKRHMWDVNPVWLQIYALPCLYFFQEYLFMYQEIKRQGALVQSNFQLFWIKVQKIQKRISGTVQRASILWRCLLYGLFVVKISNFEGAYCTDSLLWKLVT